MHGAGNSGESIINALTPGTELPTPPLRNLRPDLRSIASAPQDMRQTSAGGGFAIDDKAEVAENPYERESRIKRQLHYDDDAVNQAFPEDMYSLELSNGIPGKLGGLRMLSLISFWYLMPAEKEEELRQPIRCKNIHTGIILAR